MASSNSSRGREKTSTAGIKKGGVIIVNPGGWKDHLAGNDGRYPDIHATNGRMLPGNGAAPENLFGHTFANPLPLKKTEPGDVTP
jgi:hypothetical protein